MLVFGRGGHAAASGDAHGWQFRVDGKPFLMPGGQVNNSSGRASALPDVWKTIEMLHANTVEIAVYWENIEAKRGQYQFGEVDPIVNWAREHNLRLVLLWFGSWKNGASNYVPLWVKQDRTHFPTMIDASGKWTGVISPSFHSTLEADSKAFAALMEHLKQVDGDRHTVIIVPVENETGTFGTPRDYSTEANRLFEGAVPEKLVTVLGKKTGPWQQVFGAEAEEVFAAFGFSTYVGEVAAAGKKIYPLPMYVNSWLAEGADFQRPGENYPSGGPEPVMLDVWKSMTPALDIIGPDIYLSSRHWQGPRP
jgi:beta-galactosidase GanA